jgi:7-keto-8-aminopelargonate synthetase-like enzyme
MTGPEPLQQIGRTQVRYRGRKLTYFSGCDYFRLASHPAVLKAIQSGVCRFGLNVAASRLTTGNHPIYRKLERALAKFFGAEDALLVSSGYLTNLVVAQALAGNFSHVLMDERAHPSLLDAALHFDCPVLRFKHRDTASVKHAVARCGEHARLILLTDGVFAHDGSCAPLRDYLKNLPRDAMMLVDDAHGAGVVGKTGRGTLEEMGVGRGRIIQSITLSKAFGVYGGAVLGKRALREKILARSRWFAGSTPLPPPLANAALKSLGILKTDHGLRTRLHANVAFVKSALSASSPRPSPPLGEERESPAPIIPLVVPNKRKQAELKRRLLAAGIFPPFIKYPGGPAGGYFRFVISSEHSREQLKELVEVLVKFSASH